LDAYILGFEYLKAFYVSDEELGKLFAACLKRPKDDFLICEGYLFKGTRLCIPRSGTRELLVQEVHGGSLAGHYGENKTLIMIKEYYYWPGMSKSVQNVIRSAPHAKLLRVICYPKGFTHLCPFQLCHG